MPSHRANKWGTACEYRLIEAFDLEAARSSWRDAVDDRGRPWELKATKREHADGQPGNFKIYREYHRKLKRKDGIYGFAVYRIRGRGCQILDKRAIPAKKLPMLRWHGGGDHRGTQQAKLSINEVFG